MKGRTQIGEQLADVAPGLGGVLRFGVPLDFVEDDQSVAAAVLRHRAGTSKQCGRVALGIAAPKDLVEEQVAVFGRRISVVVE